jgi:hypothetical protein
LQSRGGPYIRNGLTGARTEISLAVMAYNLKRMVNILGGSRLVQTLANS